MIVRVLMTRKMVKQSKGMDAALLPKLSELLVELRSLANRQPGYISGESLRNVDDPNEYLVNQHLENYGGPEALVCQQEKGGIGGKGGRVDGLANSLQGVQI